MMQSRNSKYAMWLMFVIRKCLVKPLGAGCVAAILAIAVSPNARAQSGSTITHYPVDGGVIVVFVHEDGSTTSSQFPCPKKMPQENLESGSANPEYTIWEECQEYKAATLTGFVRHQGTMGARGVRGTDHQAAPRSVSALKLSGRTSDANPALTLSSSTPYLPFLGNSLVVVSYVANSSVAANVTASYAVDLRRQSDCSLTEDFILPDRKSTRLNSSHRR